MEFTIRNMEQKDWYHVSMIYRKALEKGTSTFNTFCPTYEAWDNAHLLKGRFVVVVDEEIVGWCVLAPVNDREPYRGVAEISIYFDENYCGKGLGTALLNHLKEKCLEYGIWSIRSDIFSDNKACLALHKKCGFRTVGTFERVAKDKFGNWKDTITVEYRLPIE